MVYLAVIVSVVSENYFRAYVGPQVTTKQQEIVTVLALTPSELDDIEENHQGITGVFQLW